VLYSRINILKTRLTAKLMRKRGVYMETTNLEITKYFVYKNTYACMYIFKNHLHVNTVYKYKIYIKYKHKYFIYE